MEYASDNVTAMGKPSGTATTTNVTATMRDCNRYASNDTKSKSGYVMKNITMRTTTISAAIV